MEEIHAPTARPLQRFAADRGRRWPLSGLSAAGARAISRCARGTRAIGRRRGVWLGPVPNSLADAVDALFLPRARPWRRSTAAALASAPGPVGRSWNGWRGLPSVYRPRRVAPVAWGGGHSGAAPLVRFRSRPLPFDVRWSRRAVRGCLVPDDPAAAFVRPGHPRFGRFALAVFAAPVPPPVFQPAAVVRAGHSWPVFLGGSRTGPARRTNLATWPRALGPHGDVRGISLSRPSQCTSDRGWACLVDAPAPTCRFAAVRRGGFSRESPVRATRGTMAAAPGVWPRGRAVPFDWPAPL